MDINDNYKPSDDTDELDESGSSLVIDEDFKQSDEAAMDEVEEFADREPKHISSGESNNAEPAQTSTEILIGKQLEEADKETVVVNENVIASSADVIANANDYDDDMMTIDEVIRQLSGDDCTNDSTATLKYNKMPELTTIEKLSIDKENGIEEFSRRNSVVSGEEQVAQDSMMPVLVPIPTEEPLTYSQEIKVEKDIENFLNFRPEKSNDSIEDEHHDEPPTKEKSPRLSSGSESGKKSSIVDSLLDKIRRSNSTGSESDAGKLQRSTSESDDDLLVEIDAPVCFSRPTNPNQLPTPIVRYPKSTSSAFVNNEDEYLKAIALSKTKKVLMVDDKTKSPQPEPPRMREPQVLSNIPKPRTVAEKRQLIRANDISGNSMKYLMVEQESKIFKQIQKKEKQLDVDYFLNDQMMADSVPIKPGPWKVLTWLRTRPSNFIQQVLELDGTVYKLKGSVGNHKVKVLSGQSSAPFPRVRKTMMRSTRCCAGGRIRKQEVDRLMFRNENIRNFVLRGDVQSRLDPKYLDSHLLSIKPRPLSKKIEIINQERKNSKNDEDGAFLGDYAKYSMPAIELEVSVEPKGSPLDPVVKKYLKQTLPHRDLTENWCEFALSALSTLEDEDDESPKTFQFSIPYQNNKDSLLVREIIRSPQDAEPLRIVYDDGEDNEDEMDWTFAKNADKDDPVECEIIEIIKDLTNSVFINLNDNLFTREDKTVEPMSESSPINSSLAIEELSNLPKQNNSKRILLELKRLNANVFQSETPVNDDSEIMSIGRNASAHLGKVERDLRPTVIVTESETVVVSSKETESRRVKRAPKKFEDYLHSSTKSLSEGDSEEPPAKKPKTKDVDLTFQTKFVGTYSHSELTAIKKEVRKMLHVNVGLRRLKLVDIAWFCMDHGVYKCRCKIEGIQKEMEQRRQPLRASESTIKALNFSYMHRNPYNYANYMETKQKETDSAEAPQEESNDEMVDDGFSRRVLPVAVDKTKIEKKKNITATFNDTEGIPKIEIQNLCDLINGGIGPIYINIYDDKTMRLNRVLRSLLNNKCAIVFFNDHAYFVDKDRVNIKKLDFSTLTDNKEEPIFVIQGKDNFPGPVSSTAPFMKQIFKQDSDSIVRITDKYTFDEISGIIESILRNVRRKIESKIGENQSDLVREQLSMLTRDRSHSFSSTNSSPLSFKGLKLQEAPPPGFDTVTMQSFNKVFSMRMQKLVAIIGSNTLGLHPSNEMLNKFYIYQWSFLLRSYEEDLIQIWQVTLESEGGDGYQLLVLTDSTKVPEVEHAEREKIINIRKLSLSDDITELTRMILLRVENAKLKNMTILMYGCKGYMRICGILNGEDHYLSGFVAQPTRSTHPRIAEKIQKVYKIWHKSRQGTMNKKDENAMRRQRILDEHKRKMLQKRLMQMQGRAPMLAVPPPSKEPCDAEKQLEHVENASCSNHLQTFAKPVTTMTPASLNLISSKFQQVDQVAKVTGLAPNPVGQSDFKWFLFNITNDFSDIFIKSWSRYLSFKVIMAAVSRAKKQGRAVALTPCSKSARKWPRIFALPAAPLRFKEQDSMTSNFLIFGPYMRNSNSNLLLMQNVDGTLMLRDEYEKRNNIQRLTRTRCLWIYANTLKCIQDADPNPLKLMWGNGSDASKTQQDDSSDDE